MKKDVVDVEVIYTSDGGTERETRRLRLAKNGDSFLIAGDKVVYQALRVYPSGSSVARC